MAWNYRRPWPVASTGLGGNLASSTNNAAPAAAGSTLLAVVTVRPPTTPAPTPPIVISDSHGGTWTPSPMGGDDTTSTRVVVYLRSEPANGVTSVSMSAVGANQATLHVHEYTGVPSAEFAAADARIRPDGHTWEAVTVAAPDDALVLSAASLGVTNRAIDVSAPFEEITDHKLTGINTIVAHRIISGAGSTTGAVFTKPPDQSSSSLCMVTVAIVQGEGPSAVTINVGADRTVGADDLTQLTATTTGGSGTKTFLWTVVSRPDGGGDFVEPEAQNAQFAPGGVTGTYVLRCTVTDSTGTASDELTLTVLRTLTVMPPQAVTAAGWTVTGAATALAALSDSDDTSRIASPDNPVDSPVEITCPPLMPPDQPFQVRVRPRSRDAASASAVARLYVGADLRATSAPQPITDTLAWVNLTFPLTDLEDVTPADWQAGVRVVVSFTAA